MKASPAEVLASLPPEQRLEELKKLSSAEQQALNYYWPFWARPKQLEPEGDWQTWLVLAGRGFGKTRMGAEWVRQNVCGSTPLAPGKYKHVALVGETSADARGVMVDGPAGLLAVHPPGWIEGYEPTKRLVTWKNGARATLFNATEPDQLRGPQHDLAWCDELAKWRYVKETWDMLQFGLRLGTFPRQIITTTPRPLPVVRQIMKDPATHVTRGSTYENRTNLANSFFAQIVKRYEGTRLGRQELEAEVLDDVAGALWTRSMLDEFRVKDSDDVPNMKRVVVAVDPAITVSAIEESTAETGIVAAGIGEDGRGYVLGDYTCREGPAGWARKALAAYDLHQADAIVYEVNQGGEMVAHTLRSARHGPRLIPVRASRGKTTRAEPVAALYEQGRVSHVGQHEHLEDQMVLFTTEGIVGETTADRVDALVWAFTELFNDIVQGERKRNTALKIEGMGRHNVHAW